MWYVLRLVLGSWLRGGSHDVHGVDWSTDARVLGWVEPRLPSATQSTSSPAPYAFWNPRTHAYTFAHARGCRAANLYRETAVLLAHVANNADGIRAAGVVGKEALRLLAERLCAVCLMRQTMLMSHSFRSCEQKAKLALKEHQKQQTAAAAAGAQAGAAWDRVLLHGVMARYW